MDIAFYVLSSKIRQYQLTTTVTTNVTITNGTKDILVALKQFEKQVDLTEQVRRTMFVDYHYDEMKRTYDFILQIIRSITWPNSDKEKGQLRSFLDRLYKNKLGFTNRCLKITRLFNEFVKGITYFSHQNSIESPIYHRLFACGTGDDAFRQTFNKCTVEMEQSRRTDVRTRIETCLVERLMYDTMFRQQTLYFPNVGTDDKCQDSNHIHWLEQTKEDFKTCFPNLTIDVEVEFNNMIPIECKITRSIRSSVVSIEIYTKKYNYDEQRYEDEVDCLRTTFGPIHHKYSKRQRFNYPMKWTKLAV